MAVIPRQLVDELITKYEFHPNLFDIYVEGSFDRDFINLYLNCVGLRAEVTVHAIDAIDIPSDTVDAMGLDTGSNKHRRLLRGVTLCK